MAGKPPSPEQRAAQAERARAWWASEAGLEAKARLRARNAARRIHTPKRVKETAQAAPETITWAQAYRVEDRLPPRVEVDRDLMEHERAVEASLAFIRTMARPR
jgi:hypothetical protein